LSRLDDTWDILADAHSRLSDRRPEDAHIGPAGEWFLDNFHVVREHIREIRESLPRSFYRELPELASGPLAGYPRVYELAITLISHSEGRVDLEIVDRSVEAFQSVETLSIGELWALPAMLRLGLIESVRRMTLRTVQRLDETEAADRWARRIERASEEGDREFRVVLRDFVFNPPPLTAIFVSRFLHQIRLTQGSYPPLEVLERWIAEEGMSPELAAAQSTQRLALTQIVMAHSITSLRAISGMDWKQVIEGHSALEAVLQQDPTVTYPHMTFETRDRYRHEVERIAKGTGHTEVEVARIAVDLALAGASDRSSADIRTHVGYYLVDDGLAELERVVGYRAVGLEFVHRWIVRNPDVVLAGGIVALTALAIGAALWLGGESALSAWILVALVAFIPATEVAVSTLNQLLTTFLPPRLLPKLDMRGRGGIPAEFRTAVVIPTLFADTNDVSEALDNIEVQFLANRQQHLHFAILSDFTDSPSETEDSDAEILAAAEEGVQALNARYAPGAEPAFHLFHRPRRWNSQQGLWMGWERKRGKLAEFNRFLRGGDLEPFLLVVGDVTALRQVRYVITLDADTVLPPDAAGLLIGAIAHPLNRAEYDESQGRIVRGYGILQPRVGVSLPSAYRSRFAAIFSGHPGVDPYTTAVSDLYQDLYGEGSFTGKGIYDVEAFNHATRGRFPENTLLSHDLIEGSYARAGLTTDISLYDDYPTRYLTYTRRKHRWIRGDWQLLGWLTPRVPGPQGAEPNRLPMLSRWKILDNLRRSLVEISQLLFLIAGWTILPGAPISWTMLGLGAIAAPWIVSLLLAAVRPPFDKSWRAYYSALGTDAVTSAQQLALAIVFLPHQAWISADAIARTLWRLFVSRRNLLEWQTASQTERNEASDALRLWRTMLPAVALAAGVLAVAVALELIGPAPDVAAGVLDQPASGGGERRFWPLIATIAPIVGLWIASPVVAHALSAPVARPRWRPDAEIRRVARRYALLHWRYFERFVSEETSWLVPDNFQESPSSVVAMRTSPTNIGLQLLATISAYDLGFITAEEMATRLERAFASLDRMQRLRGHFFNWYDLPGLRVLEPAYISTVDSGNLAGHLLAIRQACLAIAESESGDRTAISALRSGMELAIERIHSLSVAPTDEDTVTHAAAAAEREVTAAWASLAISPPRSAAQEVWAMIRSHLEAARLALESAGSDAEEAAPAHEWLAWSVRRVDEIAPRAEVQSTHTALVPRLEALAARAFRFVMAMDFRFLFDEERELFAIGYQPARHALDSSYYDLLASEARLASFVAIAKGDVPVDHWFRLGRTLTHASGETALVSWSGSMFEYLMPVLVMQSFPLTVLDQSYHGAVRRQITYGAARGVPWGVSECAYNFRDRQMTYQYRAFGVPDLALKRGLGHDLVVAPYASLLAAMVDPQRAIENLAVLERQGTLGPYGFRDSIDYTRPDPRRRFAVVGNYMAHHIGMGIVALDNMLTSNVWQRRFHAEPLVRAVELLLHERIPRRLVLQGPQEARPDDALPDPDLEAPAVREISTPDLPEPHIALLGRKPYTVMVSHAGSGYSRYEDIAVTRWRADGTTDSTGQFCYVRDVSEDRVWSAAHQPMCAPADWYRALLATDRVTFHRSDGSIETVTEIAVVPEDAAEVRRVTVTNNGTEEREIELTSYGEIVLGSTEADRAHPAFGNLFVETSWHDWCTAITATRRPRSATEMPLWCVHVVDAVREQVGTVTCETDRARFLGRGGSTRNPAAMRVSGDLSGTTGAVLDPIFALRTRVRLGPGQSTSVAFTTLVATSPERAFDLADRYHDPHAAQRALDLAWTSQQVELRELGVTPADAAVFQEIAGFLFYAHPALRSAPELLLRNQGSQPLLWSQGISGDWPVILATIDGHDGLPTLRQTFAAHRYMRRRGMMVDLVVLITQPSTYLQELYERVMEAMFACSDMGTDQPGGVFVRRADQLADDELTMLEATARVSYSCDGRSLARILDAVGASVESEPHEEDVWASLPRGLERGRAAWEELGRRIRGIEAAPRAERAQASAAESTRADSRPTAAGVVTDRPPLFLDNSIGGLTEDADYQMHVRGSFLPPAPWANVVANPSGGFIVTERGGGCSWAENSFFFRINQWTNDPVGDPASELLYIRDEETGEVWLPTPGISRDEMAYVVRHSPGRSTFEHERMGIATELVMGMAVNETVKLSILRVANHGSTARRLSITAFVEWTLGITREHTRNQVCTSFDPRLGAVFAQNTFDPQFARWAAFCALSEPIAGHTGDRREFLGRNGTVEDPAAMRAEQLSGTTGAGLDPCAAVRCPLDLAPGESREIVFLLGAADDEADARTLVERFRHAQAATEELARSTHAWADRLSVVTVRTPEPSFDAMINRWTLYQTLACRMWARSAVYQSGGAYGFRDQLQDAMALVYAEPGIAREHILRAAARQFLEGDVQHWWHPPSGRGVRTRFSDDLVWLPYVVEHYVRVTGDEGVLDEYVPFLEMRPLAPHEHEIYDLPRVTDEHGSVYEHCLRALRRACTVGPHGLPLIGIGDWNDGMNRVGVEGRGESVWLAWFLITTLRGFIPHVEARGDSEVAREFRALADAYTVAAEMHGWDGAWYRRAYFDDGSPLGSASSDECRIDSIAQTWSVISGAAQPERQLQAMLSLDQHLVRRDAGLIMLLTPAFDETVRDPGYIKGYLPGVRENGAQYTHAALWVVLAKSIQGDGDAAFELFQMINPLSHTATPEGVGRYKVEPYVVAADVYTAEGQLGRGGWTWYTGSASWMYRIGLEAILGFQKRGASLRIAPTVPADWREFSIEYRYGSSTYRIVVRDPGRLRTEGVEILIDGTPIEGAEIPLVDDGATHEVWIGVGAAAPADR
jgi:cellobiose phosphorylase